MSRDQNRKNYYSRDRDRDHDREWDRQDYRSGRPAARKRSRSPNRGDDKRRSRSPRKNDKDLLDENILSEISKLPEPSELWDNQFQESGFAPPPPGFQQEGIASTNIMANYQPAFSSGIYDDFPPLASVQQSNHPPVPDMASWNQMSLPPPPAPPAPVFTNVEDQIKKDAAIESEMRHQKAALSKQREDYIKKAGILKKELDTLKDQRNELRGDAKRSPSPDTKRFLKENTKLQLEIQNKLKTINNVVDMLNGIIGEEAQLQPDEESHADKSKRKSRSPSNRKFNYVYYDPEMHWCRVCNEFPPTAKDYLNHLHSPAHHKMAAAHMEAPWHTVSGAHEGFPSFPAAPTKRTPIRGLQFFVPSTAWYCKLCDQFIGDLHCASAHLKSIVHSKNYTNFVEQNPHWETDWMSDRQKAFEKVRQTKGKPEDKPQYTAHTITFNKDGFHTKRKDSPTPAPEEKKKKKDKKKKSKRKSSSSSSSNSSSSDSEPVKKKKSKSKKQKVKAEPTDDKVLTEWMSAIQMERLNDSDRKLLDNIKSRIKKEKVEDPEPRQTPEPPAQYRERSVVNTQRRRDSARRESRSRKSRSRESRSREPRDRRGSRRRDDRRGDTRDRDRDRDRDRTTPKRTDDKKPEVRKMPFIGKMPVYKHLGKLSKTEDQKKDEPKKVEDDETTKKRREEMDAEIQKKVAEFKEKIAKAQLERQQQSEMVPAGFLPPPTIHLPQPSFTAMQSAMQPAMQSAMQPPLQPAMQPALQPPALQPAIPALQPALQPPPPAQTPTPQPTPQPTLPKDFQEALDIIFPSEVKSADIAQDFLANLQPGILGMAPFPPLGMMPQMFGFDLNASLFPPRPQLYDTHVPLVPSPKPRQQMKNRQKHHDQRKPVAKQTNVSAAVNTQKAKESAGSSKNKEELDDLAMLGIDASDVGAGI